MLNSFPTFIISLFLHLQWLNYPLILWPGVVHGSGLGGSGGLNSGLGALNSGLGGSGGLNSGLGEGHAIGLGVGLGGGQGFNQGVGPGGSGGPGPSMAGAIGSSLRGSHGGGHGDSASSMMGLALAHSSSESNGGMFTCIFHWLYQCCYFYAIVVENDSADDVL